MNKWFESFKKELTGFLMFLFRGAPLALICFAIVLICTVDSDALMRQSAGIGKLRSDEIKTQTIIHGGDPLDGTTGHTLVAQVTNTVGHVTNNTILSTIEFQDGAGNAVDYEVGALLYLSGNATAYTLTTNTPDVGITVSNGYGVLTYHISSNAMFIVSDTNGQFISTLGDSTTNDTWYMDIVLPDGSMSKSGAFTPTPE